VQVTAEFHGNIVKNDVETLILSGKVQPGEDIDHAAIARFLKIGRDSFHEACAALEDSGILVKHPPHAWLARSFSAKEASDRFDVLDGLSFLISQAIASNATPEQISKLNCVATAIDLSNQTRETCEFFPSALRFQDILMRATGNVFLGDFYITTFKELRLYYLQRVANERRGLNEILMDNRASNKVNWFLVRAIDSGNTSTVLVALREQVHAWRALCHPKVS